MQAAARALAVLGLMALCACANPQTAASRPKAFVPWLPLPPAHQYVDAAALAPKPAAIPVGTPHCLAGQLEGVGLAAGIAAGNVDMPLLLRNKGGAGCYLNGFADITILDRVGRLLARAAGLVGRGTFFNDGPITEVWMPAGTPPLPKAFESRDGRLGQAFMNLSWYDCRRPVAAAIEMVIPDAGGTLRVPYVTRSSVNPYCQNDTSTYSAISRGPLSSAGSLWPYVTVDIKMIAPAEANRGTPITYYVTIANRSGIAFHMQPCADYSESLDGKQFSESYQLNCEPVATILPWGSATFAMRYDISSAAEPGLREVCWYLGDGRLESSLACEPVRIT